MGIIVGANRKETRITITLPVDKDGVYAYDEDGDPIKGKTPLTFTVPRFDCIPPDRLKAMNKELAGIADLTDDDGEELSTADRGRAMALAMLRPFVTPEVLAVLANLHLFELEQIAEHVQQGSTVTVGELLASTDS